MRFDFNFIKCVMILKFLWNVTSVETVGKDRKRKNK